MLAYPLEEALEALTRAGVCVQKTVPSGPPGAGKGQGRLRVIKQIQVGPQAVDLVIAFERYPQAGPERKSNVEQARRPRQRS